MKRMKNKRLASIVSWFLVFSMVSALAGCATEKKVVSTSTLEPMEVENVYKKSYDIIGGSDVMPIAGYYGPYATAISYDGQQPTDYVSDEIFQAIADCGVNLITSSPDNFDAVPDSVYKQLELGEKYGIGLFVTDEYLLSNDARGTRTTKEIAQRLSNYMNYPAFAGLYIVDEPTSDDYLADTYGNERNIDTYVPVTDVVAEELDVNTYVNLLKVVGQGEIKEGYEKYVKEACETMNLDFLCMDYYLFDEVTRGTQSLYLWNLAVLREYAEKYEIPFWNFIAAGSQWSDGATRFDSSEYVPTEGEFDWTVNISLAMGAKGISYFTLIQPIFYAYAESKPFDFERNGLIGAWGNKTRWYYYAQAVNEHIGVIDEVLMNAKNKGILATGENSKKDCIDTREALLEGGSFRELQNVDGDALIGCFNYQGKTALYVVNYSWEYAQDITLHFQDTYKVKVVQKSNTSYVEGDSMTLNMTAGDGVLLVFE